MAYLRDLKTRCEHAGCEKAAVTQLVDRWNGHGGYWCRQHSTGALKIQELYESAENDMYESRLLRQRLEKAAE